MTTTTTTTAYPWGPYKGYEVLLKPPNWDDMPNVEFDKPFELVRMQGLGFLDSLYAETNLKFGFNYLCKSKGEIWDLEQFFQSMQGRGYGFWIPSWSRDIVITAGFNATDRAIAIEDCQYNTYWRINRVTGRYLILFWPDNSYEIVAVTEAPTSTSLTLSDAIGRTEADPTQVMCCVLYYVRFDNDEISWDYNTDSVATCLLRFQTTGLNAYMDGLSITTTSSTTTTSSSTSTTSSSSSTTTTSSSSSSSSSTATTISTNSTTTSTAP